MYIRETLREKDLRADRIECRLQRMMHPSNTKPAALPDEPNREIPPQAVKPRRSGIHQVVQAANLQRLAYNAAEALGKELSKDGEMKVSREDALVLAQLVRAWDTAADRLRVLRGKGLPAAVKAKGHKSAKFEPDIVAAPPQSEPLKAAAN